MDEKSKQELKSIQTELRSIINELKDISKDIRKDCTGIGNEKCSDCIDRVVEKYEYVQKKLNNLDTYTLAEAFRPSGVDRYF